MSDANKTEKPSKRRRQKAREKGQIARSRELSNILAAIGFAGGMAWQAPGLLRGWQGLLGRVLDVSSHQGIGMETPLMLWSGASILRWTAVPMLGAWALSLGSSVMQGGVTIASEAILPKLEKMSPASKLRQLVSLTALSGLLKSLLPFSAIAYIGVMTTVRHWPSLVQASLMPLGNYTHFLAGLLFEVGWKSALVLLAWSGVDYFLAWRKLEGDLKMSREEVREEFKETDGNPAIKARIRRLQRQVRRQQMLRDSQTATVVIANPTHFSVALKYEPHMEAPVVVAKGRDFLAEKIKEVARWNGIPVLENPPLAHALYRAVPIGGVIPAKLYTAVAEILAFVYRAQAQASRKTTPAGANPTMNPHGSQNGR